MFFSSESNECCVSLFFFKERDLDYVTIADIIIEKNPKDKQFLEAFLTTQIFTYYLDTHYKIF